jgi:hypothetical protein
MSDAQINALRVQIESGKLETDAAYILQNIRTNTMKKKVVNLLTLDEQFPSMKVATIVARLSGLEDKGLIYKDGVTKQKIHTGSLDQKTMSYSNYKYEFSRFMQDRRRDEVRDRKMKQAAKSLQSRFGKYLPNELNTELIKFLNI